MSVRHMDAAQRILFAFKSSVLSETYGNVLDVNATVADVDLYSLQNTNRLRIIATSHSHETSQRINSLRPSRPVVSTTTLDLDSVRGKHDLQWILNGITLNCIFWRLTRVQDMRATVRLLANHMSTDAIVYIHAMHTERINEQLLCHEMSMNRLMPTFDIHDVDEACIGAGLHHIYDSSLERLAETLRINILPLERRVCAVHKVRAYQLGVSLSP